MRSLILALAVLPLMLSAATAQTGYNRRDPNLRGTGTSGSSRSSSDLFAPTSPSNRREPYGDYRPPASHSSPSYNPPLSTTRGQK